MYLLSKSEYHLPAGVILGKLGDLIPSKLGEICWRMNFSTFQLKALLPGKRLNINASPAPH